MGADHHRPSVRDLLRIQGPNFFLFEQVDGLGIVDQRTVGQNGLALLFLGDIHGNIDSPLHTPTIPGSSGQYHSQRLFLSKSDETEPLTKSRLIVARSADRNRNRPGTISPLISIRYHSILKLLSSSFFFSREKNAPEMLPGPSTSSRSTVRGSVNRFFPALPGLRK